FLALEDRPEGRWYAGAALPLQRLFDRAVKEARARFAFLGGIPGTVGGAVSMNAGTDAGEMRQVGEAVDLPLPHRAPAPRASAGRPAGGPEGAGGGWGCAAATARSRRAGWCWGRSLTPGPRPSGPRSSARPCAPAGRSGARPSPSTCPPAARPSRTRPATSPA